MKFTHTQLPGFFSNGLIVRVIGDAKFCNAPGYLELGRCLPDGDKEAGLELSKFLITHIHPDAAQNDDVVAEFYDDSVSELIANGGRLPLSSVQDWLYYQGYRGCAVA